MDFPPLHLPTLFIVTAVVIAFSGSILIVSRGRDGSAACLGLWGSALISGAAGIVILPMAQRFGVLADAVGAAMIILGPALSWTAARNFGGRQARPLLVLAGPAALLALYHGNPFGTEMLPMAAAGAMGSAYTVATAFELWHDRGEDLPSRWPAIILLLLHALVHAARAAFIALDFGTYSSLPDTLTAALVFEALLHSVGMAFLLLAIIKERAEVSNTRGLRRLALVDELTGLGNRRHFEEALNREYRRAFREMYPLSLLMIDADHFKAFNDRYGHPAGDDCLRAIARVIQSAAQRPGDLAARYGGEEFAVLLPRTGEAGAVLVAQHIHDGIAALGMEHAGTPYGRVAVSIGVAATTPGQEASGRRKLVRAADHALYAAKAGGRNSTRTQSLATGANVVLKLVS
jgi:diguanylate cyclase (GGDEF)-like protein